jgi:hypothetical protein
MQSCIVQGRKALLSWNFSWYWQSSAAFFDENNPPNFAGSEVSLNHEPYFDYSNPRVQWGPSSQHPGGVMHLFADGAARFVHDHITAAVYQALATRAGGESAGGEPY